MIGVRWDQVVANFVAARNSVQAQEVGHVSILTPKEGRVTITKVSIIELDRMRYWSIVSI